MLVVIVVIVFTIVGKSIFVVFTNFLIRLLVIPLLGIVISSGGLGSGRGKEAHLLRGKRAIIKIAHLVIKTLLGTPPRLLKHHMTSDTSL